MSQDRVDSISLSISDVIGERIRDLRTRAGMGRDELAAAARAAGAAESLTAAVVGFLETGRRGKDGRRTRDFAVDELLALAAALEVSPLELLGDQAARIVGADVGRAAREPGELETAVRKDIEDLAELDGEQFEPSLAQTAYILARAIDAGGGPEGRQLHALTKDLRATLEAIAAGRRGEELPDPADDEFGDMGDPE